MRLFTKIFILALLMYSNICQGQESSSTYLPNSESAYSFNVVLDPKFRIILTSEVNTPVVKIFRRMGDSFKKGDALIDLDKTVYESSFLKAQSALEKATMELHAKERLYDDAALSLFELSEAEAAQKAAEAEFIIAKKGLQNTSIKAPINGKVVKVGVEEYEFVQVGKELIEIIDDSSLYARFLIPSSLLSNIRIGQIFEIEVKETGKTIKGMIDRIAPAIDPSSSTIKVEAEVYNPDGSLKAGMTGRVKIKE